MDIVAEVRSLTKRQRHEYEVQKVMLFASTGEIEKSLVDALTRAKKIDVDNDIFMGEEFCYE